jgi:hypothetical protein
LVLLTTPGVAVFRHPVMEVLSSASTSNPAMTHGRFCDCLFVFISCPLFPLLIQW